MFFSECFVSRKRKWQYERLDHFMPSSTTIFDSTHSKYQTAICSMHFESHFFLWIGTHQAAPTTDREMAKPMPRLAHMKGEVSVRNLWTKRDRWLRLHFKGQITIQFSQTSNQFHTNITTSIIINNRSPVSKIIFFGIPLKWNLKKCKGQNVM